MSESHFPTDFILPESLSARSYLELSHEAVVPEDGNPPVAEDNWMQDPSPGTPPYAQGNFPPSQQAMVKQYPRTSAENSQTAKTETTETEPERKDPPRDRPVRKRGRPRLEAPKDAAAVEERRMQIRRAQRTYRQKKETTIQKLETRVKELEQTLQNVFNLLDATDEDPRDLSSGPSGPSHDLARTKHLILAEINKTILPTREQGESTAQDPDTTPDIFGYHVLQGNETNNPNARSHELEHKRQQARSYLAPRSPSPLLNRLFPTTTIYTYSNQESDLSRRLHRFCLEHTYRWLSDPHSDPTLLSRVFGLLPCIHDMPGVRRAFRRAIQSEIGSSLENPHKLPFYTLGNAGTHFPRAREDGEPIYPENMRRPGKILRRLARIMRRGGIQDWDEDWSGDFEPGRDLLDDAERSMSKEDRLRALDLDGEWFDCHDVQGYLQQKGVVLDGSSMWLGVPATTATSIYGISPDTFGSHSYGSSNDGSPSEDSVSSNLDRSFYALDAECFFDVLLANMRILGRAPGFRVRDVDVALRMAIHQWPLL